MKKVNEIDASVLDEIIAMCEDAMAGGLQKKEPEVPEEPQAEVAPEEPESEDAPSDDLAEDDLAALMAMYEKGGK